MADDCICNLCGNYVGEGRLGFCKKCELTIFQIDSIINEYLYNVSPPEWIIDGMIEIASWAYHSNPRTVAYFNTANELVFIFAIERQNSISIDELTEVNYTMLPNNKIIKLLEDALIIQKELSILYPGPISTKLMDKRWEGYDLNTPEIKRALKETKAIVSIALTKSLVKNGDIKPRRALSLLHLISDLILKTDYNEDIKKEIEDIDLEFSMYELSPHTKSKLKWDMFGFNDGEVKIISDVDVEGKMPLKPSTVIYAENMRERYRQRAREEREYS